VALVAAPMAVAEVTDEHQTGNRRTRGIHHGRALAYPVAYRSSVMTFAVDAGGAAYEKDLGPSTAKIAGAMTGYRIDGTWMPAEATK
jgi:hypothetical protein